MAVTPSQPKPPNSYVRNPFQYKLGHCEIQLRPLGAVLCRPAANPLICDSRLLTRLAQKSFENNDPPQSTNLGVRSSNLFGRATLQSTPEYAAQPRPSRRCANIRSEADYSPRLTLRGNLAII